MPMTVVMRTKMQLRLSRMLLCVTLTLANFLISMNDMNVGVEVCIKQIYEDFFFFTEVQLDYFFNVQSTFLSTLLLM